MASTPATAYAAHEPTKPTAHFAPQPFAPYDNDVEHFVYGKWEYDLLDAPRDCMVRSLPCVSVAQVSARVYPGSYGRVLATQFAFYVSFVVLLIIEYVVGRSYLADGDDDMTSLLLSLGAIVVVAFILAACWAWHLAKLRTTVRDRFQIEGSSSDDCCAMWCCLTCTVAQMARQTKSCELGTCDMEPRDALPAYQA